MSNKVTVAHNHHTGGCRKSKALKIFPELLNARINGTKRQMFTQCLFVDAWKFHQLNLLVVASKQPIACFLGTY